MAGYNSKLTHGLHSFLRCEMAKLQELQAEGTIRYEDENLLHSLQNVWDRYFESNDDKEFRPIIFKDINGKEVK